ncbi:LCP family protein [Streptomyces sp. NPDC049881]|uniref:LCP family protein n=1 Tax=Streptomyces sp. NPDC049881 TaxID=3155778 RepID=UPI00343F4097
MDTRGDTGGAAAGSTTAGGERTERTDGTDSPDSAGRAGGEEGGGAGDRAEGQDDAGDISPDGDGADTSAPGPADATAGSGTATERAQAAEGEGDDAGGGGGKGGTRTPPRRRRRWPLVVAALLALVTGATGAAAAWLWWETDEALDSIERIPDALPTHLPASAQPPRVEGDAQVYLLIGVDDDQAPDPGERWQAGVARSDTMMLTQISADRETVSVVSLPRDTWTEIPGAGEAKLNAAYSWGGPALLVETVQNLTGVRVDHVAIIDWSGFRAFTDAVGGVTVDGERMDGREALDYVRERKSLPGGDFDRTRRQQNFLRALLDQTAGSGTLTDPGRLTGLLGTVGDVVSVDDQLSNGDLRSLAWDLRGIRGDEVNFMNAPVAGTDRRRGQSVVLLDDEAAAPLWEAMRDDAMAEFLTTDEAPEQLGDEVR